MHQGYYQGYYAIIPANVRYSQQVSDGAKLLYGEITALCDKAGYCWATNAYFAALYKSSERTVSRWISELAKAGFLFTLSDNPKGSSRKIWLPESQSRVDKNVHPGVDKNGVGGRQKWREGVDKNGVQNTTVNTTSNTTVEIVKEKAASRGAPPIPPAFAASIDFTTAWSILIDTPKWRKKTTTALAASLKELEPYPPEFAVQLMQRAIANNYQGVVYDNTPDAYAKWLKPRNGEPPVRETYTRQGPNLKNLRTYGS